MVFDKHFFIHRFTRAPIDRATPYFVLAIVPAVQGQKTMILLKYVIRKGRFTVGVDRSF